MSEHEDRTFLMALREGVSYVVDRGHNYVPSGWLRKQYPNLCEDCETLERRIRAAVKASSEM
jgi:hypothetical protein